MKHSAIFLFLVMVTSTHAQKSVSIPRLGNLIMIDSASTLMIPVNYDAKLFDSNTKLALFDSYYANIIFYNLITDSTKVLFDHNVFILAFHGYPYSSYPSERNIKDLMSVSLIFYQVRDIDYNRNDRIDDEDPAILYVSDKHGNNLKKLTKETENVVGINIYDKQNFAMIKIQRDLDGDKHFDYHDKEYYYVKLDLSTFHLGKQIKL